MPRKQPVKEASDPAASLVLAARENPFRFFSFEEVAHICGFGPNTMTALSSLGAPIVARKCNPHLLIAWIGNNAEKIGKIRGEKSDE